jgi:mannose-6-phosphate isomerase-like protein (cupin superfamily)
MKGEKNRIANATDQPPGLEGYAFDGADGSQMAIRIAREDSETAEHVSDFDEYLLVVEGSYFLTINGHERRIDAGQEFHVPRGARIAGRVKAGTRTLHAFGGPHVKRTAT